MYFIFWYEKKTVNFHQIKWNISTKKIDLKNWVCENRRVSVCVYLESNQKKIPRMIFHYFDWHIYDDDDDDDDDDNKFNDISSHSKQKKCNIIFYCLTKKIYFFLCSYFSQIQTSINLSLLEAIFCHLILLIDWLIDWLIFFKQWMIQTCLPFVCVWASYFTKQKIQSKKCLHFIIICFVL